MTLETLAWIVGCLNPLSALLVGPALAGLIGGKTPRRRNTLVTRAQGAGWLILAAAQTAFLTYGWISGHNGFKWAQAAMIPIAAANFAAWIIARRNARALAQILQDGPSAGQPSYTTREDPDPVDAMLDAIANAQTAGRIRVEHRIDIGPGIPLTGKPLHAAAMRITPLDQHGNPTGTPRDILGTHLDAIARTHDIPRELLHTPHLDPDNPPPLRIAIQPWNHQTVNPENGASQPLEPCNQPVYDLLSLGPPSRCALEAYHEGRCSP